MVPALGSGAADDEVFFRDCVAPRDSTAAFPEILLTKSR